MGDLSRVVLDVVAFVWSGTWKAIGTLSVHLASFLSLRKILKKGAIDQVFIILCLYYILFINYIPVHTVIC